MIRDTLICVGSFALLCLAPQLALAQAPDRIDFGRQIQPILAKRCYPCHGPDKGEGGLRLNQRELAFAKLESGEQAVIPKDVEHSELMRRVISKDEGEQMPPDGARLTETQIDLLRRWIE